MYKVTINGQLFLLMLIERLYNAGIKCFYANTDGITCLVDDDKLDVYFNICKDFSNFIGIDCEFQNYSKCVIRDVNCYIIKTEEGKIKEKSAFLTDTFDADWEIPHKNSTAILEKAFDMPIVAKALKAYFIDNIPVREFIQNHKDLYDFCKSQKVGKQFYVKYITSINGEYREIEQQRTNRYIISNRGGKLYKINKDTNQINDLTSGYYVTLFNDYIDTVDINYNYYVHEVNKIIYLFENNQLSLF